MVEENYSEYKVTATKKSVLVKNPSFCTQPRMVTLDNPAVQPAGRELLRLAEAVPGTPHNLQATINMYTIYCIVYSTHVVTTCRQQETCTQYPVQCTLYRTHGLITCRQQETCTQYSVQYTVHVWSSPAGNKKHVQNILYSTHVVTTCRQQETCTEHGLNTIS